MAAETYENENALLSQQLTEASELLVALTDKIEAYETAGFKIDPAGKHIVGPQNTKVAIPARAAHATPAKDSAAETTEA